MGVKHAELVLTPHEGRGMASRPEARGTVAEESAPIELEPAIEKRARGVGRQHGAGSAVDAQRVERRRHPALRVRVDLEASADLRHRAVLGVYRDGDSSTLERRVRPARERVLRGQARERGAARRIFDRLDAERRDDPRGTGVLDSSREAFDLLDEEVEGSIELAASAQLQQRHEALLPPRGDGRRRREWRR